MKVKAMVVEFLRQTAEASKENFEFLLKYKSQAELIEYRQLCNLREGNKDKNMLCVLTFKSNIVRSKLEWDNETLYSSTKLNRVQKNSIIKINDNLIQYILK